MRKSNNFKVVESKVNEISGTGGLSCYSVVLRCAVLKISKSIINMSLEYPNIRRSTILENVYFADNIKTNSPKQ